MLQHADGRFFIAINKRNKQETPVKTLCVKRSKTENKKRRPEFV